MIDPHFAFLVWLIFMAMLVLNFTVSPKRRRWRSRLLIVIGGIWLLSAGLFVPDFFERKLLFKTLKSAESEQVRKLISNNPKLIQSRTLLGKTSLHMAVESGNSNIVALLLEAGADVNAKGDSVTPLHLAAFYGSVQIAEMLLKAGADVNAIGFRHNDTPLHVAAFHGHVNVVKLLLAHGADINIENMQRKTPLQLAQERRRTNVIDVLSKPASPEE